MLLFSITAALVGISATPATFDVRLKLAQPGDTLKLTRGEYGALVLNDHHYSPPLTIEGGRFANVVLKNSSGVLLRGTQVVAKGGYGIHVVQSSNMRFEGVDVTGAKRGMVIDRTSDFAVTGGNFHGLESDGIDIAQSRDGLIADNVMSDFSPALPVYDSERKLVRDGDHPDGIQAWSRPDLPPTADIKIFRNRITGSVQCIFFGNHIRNLNGIATDDGGFDRIEVRENVCRNAMPRGITLSAARNSILENNDSEALPGATLLRTGKAIKSQVSISGDGSRGCGNVVKDVPRSPAAQPCPSP